MSAKPKRLYDFPFSGNGYKIRLALAQLRLSVAYEIVDITRQTKLPAFLAMNPMGEIPVLELDDGTILRESNAILFWLTEKSGLMPVDRLGRTRVVQWMMFEQSNIDKVMGRTRFLKTYPHFRETQPWEWEQWNETDYRALDVMEAELVGHPFLVGDNYSSADICLYGYVHCTEEGGFSFTRYPSVRRWLDAVRGQPNHVRIDQLPG